MFVYSLTLLNITSNYTIIMSLKYIFGLGAMKFVRSLPHYPTSYIGEILIVTALSIDYITRCMSLHNLHTKGRRPKAVYINRIETKPSDVNDLYHGTQRKVNKYPILQSDWSERYNHGTIVVTCSVL